MYAAGVTCGDCHDPHSGEPLVDGNALCARCHLATKYDATSHDRHAIEDTASTRCFACHMRSETYMVVDPRRDHSFRVPRPDLSLAIGTPDACADCHREASPEWVARRFEEWWPERAAAPHFGETLHAAAEAAPGAAAGLRRLTEDAAQSGIVRATALEALLDFADPSLPGLVERAARDSDPLLRMAAARALAAVDATGALTAGRSLLVDPVLAVRTEAARTLSALPPGQLSAADREALDAAVAELERSLLVNAERPESHIVLGAIRAQRGDLAAARDAYEVALALEPRSVAARVNLADLLRQEGDDGAAAALLRDALDIAPDDADVHHALGLALVRLGRADEALEALERAAELDPANLRYGYVHAVAAHSTGRVPLAIRRLEELHERWPADADVLVALINYHAGLGGFAEAELYARKLVELLPGDSRARELLERIRARR